MPPTSVTVRVPATSANLGPGFDSLGVALDWTADLVFTVSDSPVPRPSGPIEHMAATAALSLYTRAGIAPPTGISVEYRGDIPVGRGLGLSAAARVAGVVAANALTDGGHPPETLLSLAVQLEGHADNAAPALLGGFQIVVEDDDEFVHLRIEPPDDLKVALLVPNFSMPTQESRKALPDRLTRNQSVHNIGRAALLVGAITQGRYDLLNVATGDVLHQPARSRIFAPMYDIFQAARDAGALGVYLSGGGSTIAAFGTERLEEIAGAMRSAAAAHGHDGRTRVCGFSSVGATVVGPD